MPRPEKQVSTDNSGSDLVKVMLILTDGVTLFGRTSTIEIDKDQIQLIDFRRDHQAFTIPKEDVSGIFPISASQKLTNEDAVTVDSPLVQTLSEVTKERAEKAGYNAENESIISTLSESPDTRPQVSVDSYGELPGESDDEQSDTDSYGEKVDPVDSHYGGPPPYDEEHKTEISDSDVNQSELDEATASSDTDNKGDSGVKVQSTRWFGGETSALEWGKIEFSDDTPLYCDWGFLTRKEGGLNSVGAGALGFSLSTGWDTPLWDEFQNKIDESKTSIHSISDEQEVTVVGHTQFISLGGEELSMSMEGRDWFAAIITPSPIKQIDQLSEYDWAIVFFKSDCFMFPKKLWEQIEDRIDVYGDVVSTNFSTPIGEAECFVKARACAYIDDGLS